MKAKLQNLNFLHVKWDFLALSGLAPSWLGVYFFLRLHAAAEKSDPFSLDIRGTKPHRCAQMYTRLDRFSKKCPISAPTFNKKWQGPY